MVARKNLLLIFVCATTIVSAQTRPNIIYIMADDLGYADLSCYGRKDYKTPHLDELASQGIKFMNAYAAAPVCTPTRAAFITGRYPARTKVGLYEPLIDEVDTLAGLSPEDPSIARLLTNAGYETYLVGKWHLGYLPQFNPVKNGFDYFYGFYAGAIDYISHGNDLYENEIHVQKDGYLTDIWADKAIDIIGKQHQKPFFLALMFNAPHWPWQGPEDKPYPEGVLWRSAGSPAVYASMMKSLDDAIGRIMNAIDDMKLAKNTVVIFTSDNGGERFSDNGIYQEGKMSLMEGGIREPAFVRWTGKIAPNAVTNQVTVTMDWTATILSLAGAKPDPEFPLDGMDIMPVIMGKKKETGRTLYWRIFQHRQEKAIRDGNWKYLQDEKGNEYLFDLQIDPAEHTDLKDQQQTIFENLKNKYAQWEKTVLKPITLTE